MKKPVLLEETTHHQLDILRAENQLKTFDQTVKFLIESYQTNDEKLKEEISE